MVGGGNLGQDLKHLLKIAKNQNFLRFVSVPKVQELMQDETFKQAVLEKNVFKLMSYQPFMDLMRDPEVRSALTAMSESLEEET